MSRMIFVNLPVRDLKASTAFYTALGGALNPQFSGEMSSCMMFSDDDRRHALDPRALWPVHQAADRRCAAREPRPVRAQRRKPDAVNATLKHGAAAGGGADPGPPQDHGFMFSRSVEDPDGNVWEIMWMHPAALAQTPDGRR